MKRAITPVLILFVTGMSGCAMGVATKTVRGSVFGVPVEQMATTVCHPSGYEVTALQTFMQNEDGKVMMVDEHATGGPGIGYAMGVTLVDGLTDVATAGVYGLATIEAASKLRPDQTRVTQTGGGATARSTGVSGDVTGNSGVIEGGDGGAGGTSLAVSVAGAAAGAVSVSEATAAQQQQMQMKNQPAATSNVQKPSCNKPKPTDGNMNQGQVLNVR